MGNLGEGLSIAVLGYAMVFIILAIIMIVLLLMKVVFGKQSAASVAKESAPAPVAVKTSAPAPAAASYLDVASIDKEEIVAVTAAALAAADQENNSKCQVRIMSVKQL